METYEMIRKLRIDANLSQDELAHKVGYTDRSSIAKVEAGKVDLTETKIGQFARALNVTPAELMCVIPLAGGKPRPADSSAYSESDQLFLESFRQLNEEGQQKVLSYIEDLLRAGIYKRDHEHFMVSKDA